MGELKSCGSLVNANAVCVIEKDQMKTENAMIEEITAELRREREKNAQLMKRILMLEAQIQQIGATETSVKKFKRQKLGHICEGNVMNGEINHDQSQSIPVKDSKPDALLVNWMSMDDYQFLRVEKAQEDEFGEDCYDTVDSVDEDSEKVDNIIGNKSVEAYATADQLPANNCKDETDERLTDSEPMEDKKGRNNVGEFKEESCDTRSLPYNRKPPKIAFCPKEVKRILESERLLLKNAQSHTIRKIIVFASLGIRHGCDDMYELDFNHFSILNKGQPYVSPNDHGEHVLYENPGIQRKIFYPNWGNPTLCPVQILEEEKAMRPSDSSCPSCLFLCIKYGGRTRNLPQNEYVRQRMGRNKLKSFGLVMCKMAMLVHVRSGSFFFKALGITLLFMAGFPDDLVQRETKYRSLDLLQKYYRTDTDAEGEELFLLHPEIHDNATPTSEMLNGKKKSTISRGKKQQKSATDSQNLIKSSSQQSAPSNSAAPAQCARALVSHYNQAMQMPSQLQLDAPSVAKQVTIASDLNLSHRNLSPYPPVYTPQVPLMYWSAPTTFPPTPYPSAYRIPTFPSPAYYISINPPPCYSHNPPSCSSSIPKASEKKRKAEIAFNEADSNSDSRSSKNGGPTEILN